MPVLVCDDRVTLGYLLLDSKAGVVENRPRISATERLKSSRVGPLSWHQASAVDEVGDPQLVYDIKVSFGHVLPLRSGGRWPCSCLPQTTQ